MHPPSESLLVRVSQQLYNLEKRDWELWTIVSLTGGPCESRNLRDGPPKRVLKGRERAL